jgi:(2Fe-2S) ferredoxin
VANRSLSSFSSYKPSSTRNSRIFLLSTMADNSENLSSEEVVVSDDVKFGFQRPEMFTKSLSGSVDPYDRHVFLCYKTRESWPPRVEDSDSDLLPKLLSGALKARKSDISVKTRLTICERRDGTDLLDGDVFIFPEMIKYRGLEESNVDNFVEEVFVKGTVWSSGTQEVLTGSHVFICAHNSRDRRCGVCGPALIDKFKEESELRGLTDKVFVSACSHVGGHKYAGNLIIFSENPNGELSGHWYGYVAPDDVPELLDQHIGKGEIIDRLWRGQMGAKVEKPEKLGEEKIANGHATENGVEKEPVVEITSEEKKENVSGCCQGGATGVSCCRDFTSDQKQETKGLSGLFSWGQKLQQRKVLTAVAVAGAVVTVAVAFSVYRKSK